MLRKLLAGVALGVTAALAIFLVSAVAPGGFGTAELKTYDWRMRLAADPGAVNRDIVLVEINNTTVRDMAEVFGHWPWPRLALSYVVDYLHRAPAKVVAVDVTLPEPDRVERYRIGDDAWSGAESDAALAESVRASGDVVMLADAVDEGLTSGERDKKAATWQAPGFAVGARAEPRPVVLAPYQALTNASVALGHNFLALDPDGPARRMPPFVQSAGKVLPSLGVAAAMVAAGIRPEEVSVQGDGLSVRDRRIPLVPLSVPDVYQPGRSHDQWTMLINYRAPALIEGGKRPYPSYEFRQLFMSEQQLLANQTPRVDPAVFRDKIVFVGFTASGLMDVFQTPFGKATMPGIQLHASVADSILANRFIRPASARARLLSVLGAALLIGLLSAFLRFTWAGLAAVVVLGFWTCFTTAAFRGGLWLNLVQPLTAGGLALFMGTAYQYFVEGREKRTVKRLFGRYVSRDVFAQLMAHPELAELGGGRREMTVLFSDIRGFTSVTERGDPEALVAQLNEYFSRMVEIVFRHHGTVDKFVGDMVMALFGAPLDDPEHAEHAVQAAVDMIEELRSLNTAWAGRGMVQLDIGIGINSGEMIAGNIGSSSIMSYTVIGDNVNLGSRLESLNKEYRTRIIMSEATRSRLTRSYETRPLGDVVVKGKSAPVAIFEIRVSTPLVTTEEHTV